MRKLAICYPGDMATVYMPAFDSMVNIHHPGTCEVRWFRGIGWCQARRRTQACEKALEWGADLIAQFDVDQIYEPDVLERLVARHDAGYRIVAAAVPMRGYIEESKLPPFGKCAWRSIDGGTDFEPVEITGGIEEAEFPTSACVLFAADDLRRLPAPWYFFEYDTKTYKLVKGEDGLFFLRMAKIGVKSYVDTSIRVRHAAVFGIDETYPGRFADWPETGDRTLCAFKKDAA
jgi:hypothetical protein